MTVKITALETKVWTQTRILANRDGHSVIWGTYCNPKSGKTKRTLGIRWDGGDGDDIGSTGLFGNEVLYVIPDHMHPSIVQGLISQAIHSETTSGENVVNSLLAVQRELLEGVASYTIAESTILAVMIEIDVDNISGYVTGTYGLPIRWSVKGDEVTIDGYTEPTGNFEHWLEEMSNGHPDRVTENNVDSIIPHTMTITVDL